MLLFIPGGRVLRNLLYMDVPVGHQNFDFHFATLIKFSNCSGFKMNFSKSDAIWIGAKKVSKFSFFGSGSYLENKSTVDVTNLHRCDVGNDFTVNRQF